MDKTAIKNFSIWARNKLIADIIYKAGLMGVTEEGIHDALPQSTQDTEFYDIGAKEPYVIRGEEVKQRKQLVTAIRRKNGQLEYKDAYRNVIEEVAYTWFNRLIAIRFMEVNDYMPAHIRVLSSESGKKIEPDLVTSPFDAEIEYSQEETEKIIRMKDENKVDELFRFLFIKQCNALNAYLPKLFEKTSDYTELLLNVSVTDQDGIVYHLVHDIKEDDFNISNLGDDGKPTGQVEIIGWMYQYYNTEPKDEAFALLKKNVKITKERIPAATQLFTPDWIVRYMVENSVGRLWLAGHEDNSLKEQWKYYLDEAEQEEEVKAQLQEIRKEYKNIKPEEIKVIDPCMGSGHILVYAFDVLMQIYESYGYTQRDAAKSIVENNIYGLDIDDRAFQLAYFAIMMKARSYNRRFLTLGIEPNLCAIQESNGIQYDKDMGDFLLSEEHRETLQYLLNTFVDAKEYGSILNIEKRDYDGFLKAWEQTAEATLENVVMMGWYMACNEIVPTLAKQAKTLSSEYDVVITNPPYMGISNANQELNQYVKNAYPISKTDLSTVFMEKCRKMCKKFGFYSMINIPVWMFLVSFEKLRIRLVESNQIVNMLHLGRGVFGSDFGTVAFVYNNFNIKGFKGTYLRLFEKQGEVESIEEKEKRFFDSVPFYCSQEQFCRVPGTPIVYWLPERVFSTFENKKIADVAITREGMATADNEKFLRYWQEVDYSSIYFGVNNCQEAIEKGGKWFPYQKGGEYCKWYGNLNYVVNWQNDGYEIKHNFDPKTNRLRSHNYNGDYAFREGFTWTSLSISNISVRYSPYGFLFDSKGAMGFSDSYETILLCMGILNSKVGAEYLKVFSPTVDFKVGDVILVPYIEDRKEELLPLIQKCVDIAKNNWNMWEKSWDFKRNPIMSFTNREELSLKEIFDLLYEEQKREFAQLKMTEEKINRILIDAYSMTGWIDEKVDDKDISYTIADGQILAKSLLSYFVGCLFGRYSTVKEGILSDKYDWNNPEICKYFDSDNIIPITDEEYFSDDVVSRFLIFIRQEFGEKSYRENIDFLADVLETKGKSSVEKIRNYFLNSFYMDHCNASSVAGGGKRPIYWLFDSGKQNGFKALIYMHRYNADTIGNLRVDYLHRMERIYESEINRMQDMIENSDNAREVTAATKRKEKLQKQLKECQEYDAKIGHLALSRIDIDLDDGVKVNYEKIQTAKDGKKYQVLAKI